MTQLIPQQKIDEAAKEYALIKNNEHEVTFLLSKSDFKSGVQFALKEIEPLICELIDWCDNNYYNIGNNEWIDKIYYMEEKTTKQLLKEFINSKNK